jgi:Domain of unknown function (DUF4349)
MSPVDLEMLMAAERPVPRPAFVHELDARVAGGFPRPARARRARPGWRLPGLTLAPALAGVASLVIAIVVFSSLTSSKHAAVVPASTGGTAALSAAPATGSTERAAPSDAAGAAPSAKSAAPSVSPFRGRRVERATALTLGVPAARMQSTAQRVYGVVGAFGGIVDSSTVSSGGAGSGATFALRVPAPRAGAAVSRLAALGRVRSQTGTATDVTGSFVSARERLNGALAERTGLLRALTKATTTTAIDALKQRLRIADGRISSARGALRRLHGRVDYARISLQLEPTGPAPVHHRHGGGGGYTPRDALGDAGRILRSASALAIVSLLLLIPLAGLAGLATAGGRVARRRRREAALGG